MSVLQRPTHFSQKAAARHRLAINPADLPPFAQPAASSYRAAWSGALPAVHIDHLVNFPITSCRAGRADAPRPQVLPAMFGPGLRMLRGIQAGWPKSRADGGPDPPDYVLMIRPYAEALMAKASTLQ